MAKKSTKKVKPKAKPPKKTGRPSKYSDKLANAICKAISTSSKGLVLLCKENESFPNVRSVYDWLNDEKYKDFLHNYARAREEQADFLADEIIAIADDGNDDTEQRYTASGEPYDVENKEWTSRSKLRVYARQWKASKLAPKKYGDKLDVTSGGDKLANSKPAVITLTNGTTINID